MKKKVLENRLNRIINIYEDLDNIIESLPLNLPNGAKEKVKNIIFNNKEINEIISGLKERRPPRLITIGRTGVGKSSLINAIFGKYNAKTSPVDIGTKQLTQYRYESNGEVLFEVIDTRGIAESTNESETTAEEDLKNAILDFDPDAVLFLSNAKERARMDEDVNYIKGIYDDIGRDIPLVNVLTHVDELHPSRIKEPEKYSSEKIQNISDKKDQMEKLLNELGVPFTAIIPVSTYLEWDRENPELLSAEEQSDLKIDFDGRYNLDELLDFLENNIDFRAAIHLMMSTRIDRAVLKISSALTNGFATASGSIALMPVPFSDIAILIPIQMVLVILIGYLSGADINSETLKEFFVSMGGVGILGYSLRTLAQQGTKLINLNIPVLGSAISGSLAYSGTYTIGRVAQAYYIEKKDKKEIEDIKKKAKKEAKQKVNS